MRFCTVLHKLKSPQNVGTIVRTHVAFKGSEIIFVGHDKPWSFRKGAQAFSRKLERLCELVFLPTDDEFFAWCQEQAYRPVAVEISQDATPLHTFQFPSASALVFGSEGAGLSRAFLDRCAGVTRISQPGRVGSLNVGVAAAIVMYELSRGSTVKRLIEGAAIDFRNLDPHMTHPSRSTMVNWRS